MNNILQKAVRKMVRETSYRRASQFTGVSIATLRGILAGRATRMASVERICRKLGLEFYIGPPVSVVPVFRALEARAFEERESGLVPLYGGIAAGGSEEVSDGAIYMEGSDYAEGSVLAPPGLEYKERSGLVALTVRGQSMEPVYEDGDTVYLRRDDLSRYSPEQLIGRVCAINFTDNQAGDSLTLKRLRWPDSRRSGEFNLESLNMGWPTMRDRKVHSAIPVRYVRRKV